MGQSNIKLQSESIAVKKKKHIGISAFFYTFGTSLFIQVCTLFQGIFIARLLGPVGRGEYAAVILWPTVFAYFGVAGIYIAIANISAKTNDHDSIVRSGIVFALITSAISSAACYAALPFIMPQAENYLLPLANLFIINILFDRLIINLNAVDQGCGNFKQFNLIRSIINPVYAAILFCFWLFDIKEVRWCVIGLLSAYFTAVMVWLLTAIKRFSFFGKLYPLKDILKQSISFSLAGIFQSVYLNVDRILMLWLLGTKSLGLYVVALSASAVIGTVTVSAGMVSFTMAAQAETGDGFEKLAKTFRLSALLWIVLGGLLAAIMHFILPFVYGRDFADAINPARMLIIGSAFAGLANMLEQAIIGQGKAYMGLKGRLAGLIVMAVLGIILSKTFGIMGVCEAYIAGQFVCLMVIILWTNKHYSVKTAIAYIPQIDDVNYLSKLCFQRSLQVIKSTMSRKNKP